MLGMCPTIEPQPQPEELFIFHSSLQKVVLMKIGKLYKYFKNAWLCSSEITLPVRLIRHGSFVGKLNLQIIECKGMSHMCLRDNCISGHSVLAVVKLKQN